MSKKVSATFKDDEYAAALLVAAHQDRTFAGYIVHCVNIETKRRKWETDTKDASQTRSTAGK